MKTKLIILLLLVALLTACSPQQSSQSFDYSGTNFKLTKAFISFEFFGNIKANQLTLEIEPGDKSVFNNSYIKAEGHEYTEKKTNVLSNGAYMQLTFLTPDVTTGQTVYWYLDNNLPPIQIRL